MKKFKIVTAMLIALVMIVSMFVPAMKVVATAPENSGTYGQISFGGATAIEDKSNAGSVTVTYAHGTATITGSGLYSVKEQGPNGQGETVDKYNVYGNGEVTVTAHPNENYTADLRENGKLLGISTKTYTLVAGSPITLDVEFNQENTNSGGSSNSGDSTNNSTNQSTSNEEVSRMEFRLNGKNITADFTQNDPKVQVDSDMNFDELEEFYVTKIVTNKKTYTYAANQYGLNLKDTGNRTILETHLTKQTSNMAYLRVEAHVKDIKETDLTAMGKAREDFYEFYITQLKLIKPVVNGTVEFSTAHMPDVYDFVSFNGIELGDTSINNFGEVTVYYGDDTIDLSGFGCNITNIELVEGMGVLKSAVDIDVANKKVKVKSNYYNEIPLKVTAKIDGGDEVVGYIKVSRVGIYISTLNKGANVFYHGASNGKVNENGGNLKVDTDKQRIVAVFYHDNTESIDDYDIIVNIVNKDGTTETKLAKPVGDVSDESGTLVGSDFILWEGDSVGERPSKISATAVKKGATSSKTTFGGATFGAGAGVTWTNAE